MALTLTLKRAHSAVFFVCIAMGSAACAGILSIDDISNDGELVGSDSSTFDGSNVISPDGGGLTDTGSSTTTDATNDGGAVKDTGIDAPVVEPCKRDAGITVGGCYFLIDGGTESEAKGRCVTAGAHLAVFETAQELASFPLLTEVAWIGLEGSPPSNTKTDFRWVTNNATPAFDGWGSVDPNEASGCVVLSTERTWWDRGCANMYTAICEKEK